MIIISLNVRSILNSIRFELIYNMMMRLDINVLLLRKSNIFQKLVNFYKIKYSQILIKINCLNNREVFIIINIKIIF